LTIISWSLQPRLRGNQTIFLGKIYGGGSRHWKCGKSRWVFFVLSIELGFRGMGLLVAQAGELPTNAVSTSLPAVRKTGPHAPLTRNRWTAIAFTCSARSNHHTARLQLYDDNKSMGLFRIAIPSMPSTAGYICCSQHPRSPPAAHLVARPGVAEGTLLQSLLT
jgi:hypothetical protein